MLLLFFDMAAHAQQNLPADSAAAFRSAVSIEQKYEAAFAVAGAHLNAGRPIAAQWWLRRAFGYAQGQAQIDALQNAFAIAADQNPLTLNFRASAAPSSNVNGGAMNDVFYLGDYALVFSPASLALSGTEISAQAEVGYRLARGTKGAAQLGFSVYGRTYTLSGASQAKAPQVSGSDYAVLTADLALRGQWALDGGLGVASVSAHLGRTDYGRAPLYSYRKIALEHDLALSARARLSLGFSVEDQRAQSTARADAQVIDMMAGISKISPSGGVWNWSAGTRKTASKLASDSFDDIHIAASYTFPASHGEQKLGGIIPTLSATLGHKSYETYVLSLDGRRDRYLSAGLALEFRTISVLGFSPVLSLSSTRTLSNVARFDTVETRATFGLQSRF